MPLVKMPNGQILDVDAAHYENVIKRQHPKAELVSENSTKNVADATTEVEAKAPIVKAEPRVSIKKPATRKKATRKKRVVKKEV